MEQIYLDLLESLFVCGLFTMLAALAVVWLLIDIRAELRRFISLLASYKAIKEKKPEFFEGER